MTGGLHGVNCLIGGRKINLKRQATMAKKKLMWKNSKAKRILKKGLVDGSIPLQNEEMSAQGVYMQHVEFTEFSFDNFQSNLRALRKKIIENKRMSHEELAAYNDDRVHYLKNTHNHRGEPRWEGSEAVHALKDEIDQGRHLQLKPEELW
jgi:hypothetical protein